ncbi:MAG TPA: PD-(D/E)XK nuclease-like domain-containing protein [Propionicimonas sp.]|nr:PD-(D/E)XK nuclease-like domain-containing protein [Propionicimonas sp.]
MSIAITAPGVYPGISDEEYHGDPVPAGSLSSSGARQILQSPAWFRYRQQHREVSRPFDVGHAVHAKVLGIGLKVEVIPTELLDARGGLGRKDAKAWVEQVRADGHVPLKPGDWFPVERMAEAILAHPTAKALLGQPGIPEASVFAKDPITEEWVRARPDFLPPRWGATTTVVDIKTTAKTADRGRFGRTVAAYGYHQQAAWYCDAITAARGDDEAEMVFVVVEAREPWLVGLYRLPIVAIERGRELNRAALDTWHQCRQTGLWPGYGDEIQTVDLPAWALWDDDADEIEV